jgi:hypothetical protein
MREVLPGIHHWTAFHEGIGFDVSSYYVEAAAAVIDPMLPADGLAWFEGRPVERVLLTCRHHYRRSDRFAAELGARVLCNEAGLHEFEGGPPVEGFRPGQEVAPGITAVEVDAISPDESALHVAASGGAVALADGLVNWGGEAGEARLGFVPDNFMGDDPEAVKRGLRAAFERLLERPFEHLLFAHGDPVTGEGRRALERFLAG